MSLAFVRLWLAALKLWPQNANRSRPGSSAIVQLLSPDEIFSDGPIAPAISLQSCLFRRAPQRFCGHPGVAKPERGGSEQPGLDSWLRIVSRSGFVALHEKLHCAAFHAPLDNAAGQVPGDVGWPRIEMIIA